MFREVTLFEELQLLKEFEKFENEMEEKVDNKMSENVLMLDKVTMATVRLDTGVFQDTVLANPIIYLEGCLPT